MTEAVDALDLTLLKAQAAAQSSFAGRVQQLKWTDPKVTEAVHALAASGIAKLGSPVPTVCTAMKAWAASGYRSQPPSTLQAPPELEQAQARLARAIRALGSPPSQPPAAVLRAVRRYATGGNTLLLSNQLRTLEEVNIRTAAEIVTSATSAAEHAVGLDAKSRS